MSGTGRLDVTGPACRSLLARCRFPPAGTPVSCATSGGADSMALVVLAVAAGCTVTAIHVDHGLRPGSGDEAEVVARLCDRLGVAFCDERVCVAAGSNLEARARAARYAVLPAGVLTGHTADDRAETMVLNLVRGAGPTGMAGIARSDQRPLLDLRRAETRELCRALELTPVEDPTNADPRFARNRVRHEVLPLLSAIGDRDPVPVLVRQADLFAQLAEAVAHAATAIDPTNAAAVAEAPGALAGAAVQSWLRSCGVGDGAVVDAGAVERVLAVARKERVATEVAGGWRVARSAGRLSVTAPGFCKDAGRG